MSDEQEYRKAIYEDLKMLQSKLNLTATALVGAMMMALTALIIAVLK